MRFKQGTVDSQLQTIREVTVSLAAHGIAYWLFGGWTADFAVGHVTRPHSDIEIIVWRRDLDTVHGLLARLGFDANEREEWYVDYRRSADAELLTISLLTTMPRARRSRRVASTTGRSPRALSSGRQAS